MEYEVKVRATQVDTPYPLRLPYSILYSAYSQAYSGFMRRSLKRAETNLLIAYLYAVD